MSDAELGDFRGKVFKHDICCNELHLGMFIIKGEPFMKPSSTDRVDVKLNQRFRSNLSTNSSG